MFSNILKNIGGFLQPISLSVVFTIFIFFGARYFINQIKIDREGFLERINEIQSIHDKELGKIMNAQAEERDRHEKNLKKLQQELNDAVVKHEEKLRELEHQREIESKRLFEKYRNDPAGLAQEISRVTGIPVYLHEDKK